MEYESHRSSSLAIVTDCDYSFDTAGNIIRSMMKTTVEECVDKCLNQTTTCNHFHRRSSDKRCDIIWAIIERDPLETGDESWNCAIAVSFRFKSGISRAKKN